MRILHVLSQLEPTGAEFYAVSVAEEQRQRGHEVIIVSDNLFVKTDLEFIPQPIGDRRYFSRFQNVGFLKHLVANRNIDIVHCHSRAASWVAFHALKKSKVPLVSTIHGRQHIHSSSKRKNIYGEKIIPVCRQIEAHLINDLRIPPSLIEVVPNPIGMASVQSRNSERKTAKNIAIIGRTSGPKGLVCARIIKEVFPRLLEEDPEISLHILGGDTKKLSTSSQAVLTVLKSKYQDRVFDQGFVADLPERLLGMDVVIASGRTAVEACLLKVPTVAFGEACCEGLVQASNLDQCISSNFGDVSEDHLEEEVPASKIRDAIKQGLELGRLQPELTNRLTDYYNLNRVVTKIQNAYCSARARKGHPKNIPNLMYHKVPKNKIKTKHKTFITAENFHSHLRFFKRHKFTPITYKQYFEYWSGQRRWEDFPQKPIFLTFDDGYLDNYENVLPLIKKFNYPIVLFPLSDASVKTNYWDLGASGEQECALMNWSQVSEFAHQGSEIGSHGLRHLDLTELEASNKWEEIRKELVESRQHIKAQTGFTPITFAYPFGRSSQKIRDFVKSEGYIFAVSTDSGGQHIEDDLHYIFRVNIFPTDGYWALLKKCSSSYRQRFFRTRGR